MTLHLEAGDEDEALVKVMPERGLYLAVFCTAVHDLMFTKDPLVKARTLAWFKGAKAPITFAEIKVMFKFTESRFKKLDAYLNGEIKLGRACKRKYFHSRDLSNRLS